MKPLINVDKGIKHKIVSLDYSRLRVNPLNPKPDPFIERYAGRTYYNPWLGIDFRMNPWMEKNRAVERTVWQYAEESITVPTILPTFLDPEYIYAVPTDAPAYAALPRKASLGAHEDYVRMTALGAPTSYFISEDDAKTKETVFPTAERKSIRKVIGETWGGVSGFQQAAGKGFKDMLAESHQERLYGLLTNGLEAQVINGTGTAPQMAGLLYWQELGTDNIVTAGAAVTIAHIQDAIRQAWVAGGDLASFGFALTDPATYDNVKALLTEYLGYVNVTNYHLPWGLKTYEVDGVPFLKSRAMPTGANVKKIIFVDRRYTYLAVLQDVTTELYGKVADMQEFAIKWYGNVINRAPEFGAEIETID